MAESQPLSNIILEKRRRKKEGKKPHSQILLIVYIENPKESLDKFLESIFWEI